MGVEENLKTISINGEDNKNSNLNLKEDGMEIEEEEDTTLLSSQNNIVEQPHLLEHLWTFWFDNPSAKSRQAAWGSSMHAIYTFFTIEQFWSLYNNIHHLSKLAIEPKWEDPVCANGGKWTVTFHRGKSDTCWLYTLLALIGEQFDYGDEICGAVVNLRGRQEKIALWTKNAANETFGGPGLPLAPLSSASEEILDHKETIGFIFYKDAKHDRGVKNRYTV
ncbi:eukaryotic translation initiation factor 4E [Hibiscus trionum]|uniref:Eukaryotic translation initiation factor 4E-1 n=1 Tax=Hibiscus trionum TaxID=183268 RepID=A0A9W7IC05_HIBTR|nr:eukaryotic translation initiation factor 4E [Hibiscus trionum]